MRGKRAAKMSYRVTMAHKQNHNGRTTNKTTPMTIAMLLLYVKKTSNSTKPAGVYQLPVWNARRNSKKQVS